MLSNHKTDNRDCVNLTLVWLVGDLHMRLVSIETTPNPHSMKLNFDESLGETATFTGEQSDACPQIASLLLAIDGVKSLFVCHDFITVNRNPKTDWKMILEAVTQILPVPESVDNKICQQRQAAERTGQISVLVQTFRGIPVQVKVSNGTEEKRMALDTRFSEAAKLAQEESGADYLKERYWADWGVRYGSLADVCVEVVEEIQGSFEAKGPKELVAGAQLKAGAPDGTIVPDGLKADVGDTDWHRRLRLVQDAGTTEEAIPVLLEALNDANHQVRRMAAAALGATANKAAIAPLCVVLLNDSSAGVRRTAGDALSDLGDSSAQAAVCLSLADPNKLVRWRAARFLADIGSVEALPFLRSAANDPEFEVALEVAAAIVRISGGKAESLPVWKQILKNQELPE